jgi:putative phosphoesterase
MELRQILQTIQSGGTIGLLSDTHCHRPAVSDVPAPVLKALEGVDLIIHLGDMGEGWMLDRLESIAPVVATRGGDDPASDNRIHPWLAFEAGNVKVGMLFDLSPTGIKMTDDGHLRPPERPVADILNETFGCTPAVIAFGATHREMIAHYEHTLFVNPGSATLPAGPSRIGTIALMNLRNGVARVEMVQLRPSR